jgi:hypothetical protein
MLMANHRRAKARNGHRCNMHTPIVDVEPVIIPHQDSKTYRFKSSSKTVTSSGRPKEHVVRAPAPVTVP